MFLAIALEATSPPGLPVYDKTANILWVKCKVYFIRFTLILIQTRCLLPNYKQLFYVKESNLPFLT